jgi:predicted flap endonuclease-1-like 5' DNA nuclease
LQGAVVAAPAPVQAAEAAPDPDRWKWRARDLEARVRHLEQRPAPVAAQVVAAPLVDEVEPPPPAPAAPRVKPPVLASSRSGAPDDLTLIDSVSLLQQTTFYSLGVFHYDQIAAWTPENVAWVDHFLRLRGRIGEEEWIEQAEDLAREGPAAARRVVETEET